MLWNEEGLRRRFSNIGADFRVSPLVGKASSTASYTLDVREIRKTNAEQFILSVAEHAPVEAEVLHARPSARHLLLLVKAPTAQGVEKHRYLCGHDERHWFVASVPDADRVATTVEQAMDALQPKEIRDALRVSGVRHKDRHVRHNSAFVRQGEWFFIPAPGAAFKATLIHRNEPLMRGGKPHWVQELVRWGGETRYVCRRQPQGLTEENYRMLLAEQPEARSWGWRVMQANPEVFVRGRVWHPDHATVELPGWHRVLLNEEKKARWSKQVVFLD